MAKRGPKSSGDKGFPLFQGPKIKCLKTSTYVQSSQVINQGIVVLLSVFLSQALAQRQLTAISELSSREPSHRLRKGLIFSLCHNCFSVSVSIWSALGRRAGEEVAKESSGRSFLVKKQNLELCCNHVRKERLRTCQTSKAGSSAKEALWFAFC